MGPQDYSPEMIHILQQLHSISGKVRPELLNHRNTMELLPNDILSFMNEGMNSSCFSIRTKQNHRTDKGILQSRNIFVISVLKTTLDRLL